MNQYFVPALIAIVLSALIIFFVLPKLSPYILGGLSITMLLLGIWQHYSMFPYEYRTSIVTELLQQYAGFIMVLLVILSSIIGILFVHGTNLPSVSEVIPEIPAIVNNSKNNSKNMFNFNGQTNAPANAAAAPVAAPIAAINSAANGIQNAVSNVVTNAYNAVANIAKPNNAKKNNLASPSFKVV